MNNCHLCGIEFEGKMLKFWWEDGQGLPYEVCEVCNDRETEQEGESDAA